MSYSDVKESENLLLFIHDKKRLQKESDDPIKAVVYFSSDETFQPDKMCWFVNSTVTLCSSVASLVGSEAKSVTLDHYKLAVYQISSVTVCIGCSISSGLQVKELLQSFISFVRFKFFSVENMVQETKNDVKLSFDLHEAVKFIKEFNHITSRSTVFLKTNLLLEHILTINGDFGCVLMENQKVLNSTLAKELTILLALLKVTSDFDSAVSSLDAFLNEKWFKLYYSLYLSTTKVIKNNKLS